MEMQTRGSPEHRETTRLHKGRKEEDGSRGVGLKMSISLQYTRFQNNGTEATRRMNNETPQTADKQRNISRRRWRPCKRYDARRGFITYLVTLHLVDEAFSSPHALMMVTIISPSSFSSQYVLICFSTSLASSLS